MHYSNALFTTCIANGALILQIKSSNCVFVRRLPNIEGDNAASDPNLTNLSAFVQNIYILPVPWLHIVKNDISQYFACKTTHKS